MRYGSLQTFFFFQAEDGIRDPLVTGVPDVCSSDLRVRDHALDVRLHERDQSGHQERPGAEPGGQLLDVRRLLEDRVRADDQIDACGHHRRRVDQEIGRASCRERGWTWGWEE